MPSSLDLEKIDGRARESAGRKYLLSVVEPAGLRDPKLKAKFTGLGYRLWRTEALMARSTLNLPQVEVDAEIRLVETQSLATQLAAAAGSRMLLPEHLGNPSSPVRCYVAMRADHIAGWARSISIGEYGWCASMFVAPESRRRGYGRALVAAVLRGDRAAGLKGSILAASHTGAKLYAAVDYATIGTVHVLVPAKK